MALNNALPLDPYADKLDIWVAKRTAGLKGAGTMNDPCDGSAATRFDGIMNLFQGQSNVAIHLGSGKLETRGCCIDSETVPSGRPRVPISESLWEGPPIPRAEPARGRPSPALSPRRHAHGAGRDGTGRPGLVRATQRRFRACFQVE